MRGGRARPEWSPDGKWIAFLEGESEKKYAAYGMEHLALVPTDGSSAPTLVKAAADLDRGVSSPHFTADGSAITFLVTDDRSVYPARVRLSGGPVERLMPSPVVVSSPTASKGCSAVLSGGDTKATEVYAMEGGALRQLTHQNDALMSELEVAPTRGRELQEQGRHRGARPAHQAGRLPAGHARFRCCCASTAGPTGRTRTRSASSGRCSPPTATPCWR